MRIPTISFILPHLGSGKRELGLKKCIDSIVDLDYPRELKEIIVMDGPETVPVKVKMGYKESRGEWIVYAANDCEFERDSISVALGVARETGRRLVAFNTGEVYPDHGNICEHFMIRRDLVELLEGKEIFCTEFHHTGVDNFLWAQCEKLEASARAETAFVRHRHFTKGADFDDVYRRGWEHVTEDRALLKKKLESLYG